MASSVVCIGSKALFYADSRTKIKVSRKNVRPCPIAAAAIFADAPPFVVFHLDQTGKFAIDANVLSMVDQCRFESGRLTKVPWSWILQWAHISTPDKGQLFLERLTLGTNKSILRPIARKRKNVPSMDELVSFTCSEKRHVANCATSTVLTRKMVDRDFYESTGVILCLRCNRTRHEWSGDGYLNLARIRPILNHMDRDPEIAHLVEMLLILSNLTMDTIGFFRFGNILRKQVPADFKLSLRGLFHDPDIQLGRILPTLATSWQLFGLKSGTELDLFLHAALHFRIFGNVEPLVVHPILQSFQLPAQMNWAIREFANLPVHIELIAVSVFVPDLVKTIFRDPLRHVVSYVHVYALDTDRLEIPGIESVCVRDLASIAPSATIVVWPAHTFTAEELGQVCHLQQAVILAGTPYLVPDRELHGLFFTEMVDRFCGNVRFKVLASTEPVAKLFDTYPCLPIPVNHPLFYTDRICRLYCPSYTENGEVYFDRILLTGLLANSNYNIKNVSFLPGELIATTLLATAVSGKHVRVSHRDRSR